MDSKLAGKKVLVFDWDGTLFDSMEQKIRNFSETFMSLLSDKIPEVTFSSVCERYSALSGFSRKKIFQTIVDEQGLVLEDREFRDFSNRLSEANRSTLGQAKLFPDAALMIDALSSTNLVLYVSSSCPGPELEYLTPQILESSTLKRFSGIFGSSDSFEKGPQHFARIMQEQSLEPSSLVFFGDDSADLEIADRAGIDGVLVDRTDRFPTLELSKKIRSFTEITFTQEEG